VSYAIAQDLIDRFGLDELIQLTDREGTGDYDPNIAARALADADEEINGYLRGRETLPLASVPAVLKRVACDIARYRLFGISAPEEVRKRYEDARAWLRDVASGRVVLFEPTSDKPTRGFAVVAPDAVFTSDVLGKMP